MLFLLGPGNPLLFSAVLLVSFFMKRVTCGAQNSFILPEVLQELQEVRATGRAIFVVLSQIWSRFVFIILVLPSAEDEFNLS